MRLRRQVKRGSDDAEGKSAQEVARSARALLNKLTAETFERLCVQMIALIAVPFFTEEHLAAVVTEIFSKAIADHSFCPLYANLCARLDAHMDQRDEAVGGGSAFRTSLQRECEARIERDQRGTSASAALAGLEGDARYEMEVKLKRGRIGSVRFLGELLLRKMLPPPAVLAVAKELLNTAGDGGSAIESLVAMLQVISPKPDNFDASFSTSLQAIYASLRRRTKDELLPPRMRFLIRDLLDLLPKEPAVHRLHLLCTAATPRNQTRTPRHSAVWKPKHRSSAW
jgi:hypothetical protein